MARTSPVVNVMQSAARKVARGLVRDFGEIENLQVSRKGPGDFVTNADTRVDRKLRELLSQARPKFGFLTEEGGAQAGEDGGRRWIVDPIDGTTNFMHGIPMFAVSIALEEAGNVTAGVVYAPITDEMFWAERGQGAYLNDRRLRVAARRDLQEAVIATGIPHLRPEATPGYLPELRAIMDECAGVRRLGSAALDLAYVAAGRFDGFWETGLSPWDVAAGLLLVRESGGMVSRTDGGTDPMEKGDVLAGNDAIHTRMLRLIRQARRPGPATG
ncbi:MAG: inositol monophosphatase family protein [Alphaproteobacteria bacterium]|jgi:myo-inositol-1(or 4)-monophosphatase|nr:inositol monophosphatase family protein [Alphaproteobacteria bacterium]MDP6565450.1 inositol monophosphatase family protein [Alphaproteobacteria bacterium]MDP6815684.1 inositol monophosphatase family protein [Alphaproteobacteria bacterium]